MTNSSVPLLSVILVNYNGRSQIGRCLSSLRAAELHDRAEILVVDNNSQDGSPDFIRQSFPEVRLLANSENIGFGAANNRGAAASRGAYLLFLNTDTEVYPGALSRLIQELDKEKSAGAAGPLLVQEGGRVQVSCGSRVNFLSEMWKKILGNTLSAVRLKRLHKSIDVHWLSGACLLIRRSAWDQASGFDETFFLYFEDIDLCYRLNKLGWRLRYVPAARVFHEGGASTSRIGMKSRLFYRSSQVYFYRKHNRRLSRILLMLFLWIEYSRLTLRGRWQDKDSLRSWYRSLLKGTK